MYRTKVVWLGADAFYAFQSRGFGGQIGVATLSLSAQSFFVQYALVNLQNIDKEKYERHAYSCPEGPLRDRSRMRANLLLVPVRLE